MRAAGNRAAGGGDDRPWAIFRLQSRKEERDRREKEERERQERRAEEVRQLRRVQFGLSFDVATLDDLWTQWLAPASKFGGHWAHLQPHVGFVAPEPLSLERIEFLLEAADPNLFSRLHQVDRRVRSFIASVGRYSQWREEASARIEDVTEHPAPSGFWTAEVEKAAGPRLHYQLKAVASELFERCPSVVSRIDAAMVTIMTPRPSRLGWASRSAYVIVRMRWRRSICETSPCVMLA